MLHLILAETSLEVVPDEVVGHPQVRAHARKLGVNEREAILDKSYHYNAMSRLKHKEKRGRPDIVHFCLLEALGSPLNLEGLLRVHVHTINDYVLTVNPRCRLPRNYNRFIGLLQQLFRDRKIEAEGTVLLQLRREGLDALLKRLRPSHVAAFTRKGRPLNVVALAESLKEKPSVAALVGGFPTGHFTTATTQLANDLVCMDPAPLDSWVVCSRVLGAFEFTLGLTENRIQRLR